MTVNLSYQVKNTAELPSDSLEEAEKQLWPKIRRALRQTSRQFTLTDIARADAAMQDTLEDLVDGGLDGFGLKVVSADVSLDLDEATRKHYAELANVKHAAALKAAELEGLKPGTDFFTGLIKQGDWAVLAVAVSKGEITIEELYQRLNQQDRERLAMQFDLLKILRTDNAKDEKQDWRVSQQLMDSITGKVAGTTSPQSPSLESPAPKQAPPSAEKNKARKSEDVEEEQ